jgi:hypothetical protein
MPLFRVNYINKHGIEFSKIIFSEKFSIGINPKNFGNHITIKPFKYDYKHEIIPPVLYLDSKGKKRLNTNTKVHPQTELEDINWLKPKQKVESTPEKKIEFKSSSSNDIYYVTVKEKLGVVKYHCDCMGFIRSRGNCKHVKEVKLMK